MAEAKSIVLCFSNTIHYNKNKNTNKIQYNKNKNTNKIQYNKNKNTNTIQYNKNKNIDMFVSATNIFKARLGLYFSRLSFFKSSKHPKDF